MKDCLFHSYTLTPAQLWKSSGSCKTSLWFFFYWVRCFPFQTLKSSHNLFTALVQCAFCHMCLCAPLCLFQEVRKSVIWTKIQVVSHGARTKQDLHSVLVSGSLARIRKEKGAKNCLQSRTEGVEGGRLASPGMRVVDNCLITSSDLFLFHGWRRLERLVIFPWSRFNQRFSFRGWTKAA